VWSLAKARKSLGACHLHNICGIVERDEGGQVPGSGMEKPGGRVRWREVRANDMFVLCALAVMGVEGGSLHGLVCVQLGALEYVL
jgi:hypothetical protein